MDKIVIIALKEIKELLKVKSSLIMGLGFAIFFAFIYSESAVASGSLDGSMFFLCMAIALFTAYTSTAQVFLLEKREGVIETLMCAPVSLRRIWAGKTLAGLVPSWITSIIAALALAIISNVKADTLLLPDIAVIVHVLATVPLFIAAFVGLVGFGQLLLGMKENRLLSFIVFMPAFAALYGSGFAIAGNLTVGWLQVGIAFGASLALLLLATWLTGFLSRERIATTIE